MAHVLDTRIAVGGTGTLVPCCVGSHLAICVQLFAPPHAGDTFLN